MHSKTEAPTATSEPAPTHAPDLQAWRKARLETAKKTAAYRSLASRLQKFVDYCVRTYESPEHGIIVKQAALAKHFGVTRQTVNGWLAVIVEAGVLKRETRARQGAGAGRGRTTNRYRLNPVLLAEPDISPDTEPDISPDFEPDFEPDSGTSSSRTSSPGRAFGAPSDRDVSRAEAPLDVDCSNPDDAPALNAVASRPPAPVFASSNEGRGVAEAEETGRSVGATATGSTDQEVPNVNEFDEIVANQLAPDRDQLAPRESTRRFLIRNVGLTPDEADEALSVLPTISLEPPAGLEDAAARRAAILGEIAERKARRSRPSVPPKLELVPIVEDDQIPL